LNPSESLLTHNEIIPVPINISCPFIYLFGR